MPKKKPKGKKIERITKLITDGKLERALELTDELTDVSDIEALFVIGIHFGQKGVHDAAYKIFDRVTMLNPNYAEAWANKGITLGDLGKYDEEIKCYDEAIKINPNLAEVWSNKGVALGDLGKYDEEIKCYDEAIKINPNYDKAWSNKGNALGNLGKHSEAIKCYDEAIKINPNYDKAWFNKGNALGNLGKYDEAIKCYDEAVKINPNYDKAWSNKGIALGDLGKYDEEIKCYDEAIKINPNLAEVWYNKSIALGNLEKHSEAIKCYDEAIKINPNYDKAWSNKGTALGKLERYDEAIKCYDEAVKINPNYDAAWYNKGTAMGKLERYDEAIKCYDEAIKINPNYAQAYGNKGITLLNTRKYDETKAELITARKLFSKRGMEKDVNKAYEYELLAINGSELLSGLRPLDEQFMSSLNSRSLAELKESSLKISESIEGVIKTFEEKKLPSDASSLLISKAICFTVLSDALSFKKVNLEKLEDAKRVFKEWKLNTFVMALNSLDNFIYGLGKYKSLEGIPEAEEKFLLQVLRISYILDGKLTDEITSKIRGEPFTAKPTAIEKEPEIKYVSIADTKKSRVRVCLVQLDFSLTKRFPYTLSEKDKLKKKIFEALRIAKGENVDVICFPELSFAKGWTEEIKDNYKDMMIICGSFYEESNRNLCRIIMGTKDYPYAKCYCSIMEEPNGEGLKKGNNLFIFQTKYGIISVLMCVDFDYEYAHVSEYVKSKINKQLNLVINPRCDIDSEHKFQAKSNLSIDLPNGSRSPTFILHINAKRVVWGNNKGGGGTTIIGYEHIHRIEKYKKDGLRPEDEIKYKIYEAKDEMMLIADLNFNIEEITERRTKAHNFYKHDGKGWKVLGNKRIWP